MSRLSFFFIKELPKISSYVSSKKQPFLKSSFPKKISLTDASLSILNLNEEYKSYSNKWRYQNPMADVLAFGSLYSSYLYTQNESEEKEDSLKQNSNFLTNMAIASRKSAQPISQNRSIMTYNFTENPVYSGLVTDLELAILSAVVYRDIKAHQKTTITGPEAQTQIEDKRLQWWQALHQHGWEVFHHVVGAQGFRAIAYVHHKRKQVVIAFRGTEPKELATVWVDYKEVCSNKIGPHCKQACKFTKEVQDRLKNTGKLVMPPKAFEQEGYYITFTGHSLGAWIASGACTKFRYPSVVFDNPGTEGIIKEFRKYKVRKGLSDEKKFPIINYQAMPNLINTTHPPIGRVFQLTTQANKLKQPGLSMQEFQYTLGQHNIELIVDSFDLRTGMPYLDKIAQIENWPHGGGEVAKKLVNILPPALRNNMYLLCELWFTKNLSYLEWMNLVKDLIKLPKGILGWIRGWMYDTPATTAAITEAFMEAYGIISKSEYVKWSNDPAKSYQEEFERRLSHETIEFDAQSLSALFFRDEIILFLREVVKLNGKDEFPFPEQYAYLKKVQFIKDARTMEIKKVVIQKSTQMTVIDLRRELMKELPTLLNYLDKKSVARIFGQSEKRMLDSAPELILESTPEITDGTNCDGMSDSVLESTPKITGLISYGIPSLAPNFLHRESVSNALKCQFENAQRRCPKIQALVSAGGTGKTQLAIEFAREAYEHGDYTAVIWIASGDNLQNAYQAFAKQLCGDGVEQMTSAEQIQVVMEKLAHQHESILFVFDNVNSYDELDAYLSQLPIIPRMHVLLTARDQQFVEYYGGIHLDRFSEQDAIKYTKANLAGLNIEDKEALDLAKLVNFHPLSLSYLTSYIRTQNLTLETFYAQHQKQFFNVLQEVILEKAEKYFTNRTGHVSELLQTTMKKHSSENQKKAIFLSLEEITSGSILAKNIVELCAFLAADGIPASLLKDCFAEEASEEEFFKVIQTLKRYSFISDNSENSEYIYMHRLLQKTLRHELKKNAEDYQILQLRLLRFFNATLKRYTDVLKLKDVDLKEKSKLQQKFIQAQIVCKHIDPKTLSIEQQKEYADALLLLEKLLYKKSDYFQAQIHLEQALAIYRNIYNTDNHLDVARCFNRLGDVLSKKGDYIQAQIYFEQALAIQESVNSLADIASTLSSLGCTLQEQSKYAVAQKMHERSLALFRSVYHTDSHKEVSNCLFNLGSVFRANGDYSQAKLYYEQALSILKTIHKTDDHPDIANILRALGGLLYFQSDYIQARGYYEQALAMHKAAYGTDNHPDIADCLNGLGIVCNGQHQFATAQQYLEQAIPIYRNIHKTDNHNDVAMCFCNLGTSFSGQRKYVQAQRCFEQALEILRAVYGTDNNSIAADCLNNFGILLFNKCDYIEAMKYFKRALAAYRAIYKTDSHPHVASTFHNLGVLYKKQGKFDKAKKCFEQALTTYKAIYGTENNVDIINCLSSLGNLFFSQENYPESALYYEKALAICQMLPASNCRVLTANCFRNIGGVLLKQRNYNNAQKCFTQALAMYREIYEMGNHPDIANTLYSMGNAFYEQKDSSHARIQYEHALVIYRAIHQDENNVDVANSLYSIGRTFQQENNVQEAARYFERVLAMRRSIYKTTNHADVAICFYSLGCLFEDAHQYSEAERYFKQALMTYQIIYATDDHPDVKKVLDRLSRIANQPQEQGWLSWTYSLLFGSANIEQQEDVTASKASESIEPELPGAQNKSRNTSR